MAAMTDAPPLLAPSPSVSDSAYAPPVGTHSLGLRVRATATSSTSATSSSDNEDDQLALTSGTDSDLATPLLTSSGKQQPQQYHHHHRHRHHRRPCIMACLPVLSKQGVILLLCVINLLNYVDRGIIPGSPEQFQHFISQTLHVSVTQQGFYLGLLASAFIASYSVCSMGFGYLSLHYRPFRLMALGLSIWVVAVICCGLAHAMESYYLLAFGRVLSGVGEASFQCNATPFIHTHAPPRHRSLWMGVFLASITVGTASGYIYGSLFSSTAWTWAGAFYFEGILMVLLILACLYCVPSSLDVVPSDYAALSTPKPDEDLGQSQTQSQTQPHPQSEPLPQDRPQDQSHDQDQELKTESFAKRWGQIFGNYTFLLVVLGHASYTFSLSALSVFAPVILIGLGMYESETQVATAFGALIVVTGTLGTPAGGLLLDRLARRRAPGVTPAFVAVRLLFALMAGAFVLACVLMACTHSRAWFLTVLALCFALLCALNAAETVAVMELFPPSRHAMATAANTLVIHVLGDVPSPLVLGALKDAWAPRCGTVDVDGHAELNPDCHLDHDGLVRVLLVPVLWFSWAVLLWGVATLVLRRQQRQQYKQKLNPSSLLENQSAEYTQHEEQFVPLV